MMKRNKLLSKTGFYYYNLLAFITNGNKRFVDKKLIFGALLIGLSSQYGCKTKTNENQSNANTNKNTENKKDTTKKEEINGIYLNNDKNTTIKKEIDGVEINCTPTCYLISKEPQKKPPPQIKILKVQEDEIKDSIISNISCYLIHEDAPEFPGGDEKRIQFFKNNLIYPQKAKDSNIRGTVYVFFVVEKDGKIDKIRIPRGLSKECDEEAVRVTKLMPKWKPGEQMGKPVSMQMTMPIKFTLDTLKK